ALVVPDLAARSPVDRPGVIQRAGDVEHPVEHDRRRLELVDDARLERPLRGELRRIRGRDLRQWTEPLTGIVAVMAEPARRIPEAVEKVLRGDALCCDCQRADGCE